MFSESFVLLIITLSTCNTVKILGVFPTPSISHQVYFRPLMLELAKRGHKVTVVTPDPIFKNGSSVNNFREIDVHDISYEAWKVFLNEVKGDSINNMYVVELGMRLIADVFEVQMKQIEVQDLLKNEKFDLVFTEQCARVSMVIAHVYKVPHIQMSSIQIFGSFEGAIGMAFHPLLAPSIIRQRIQNLKIWDKIVGIYEELHLRYFFMKLEKHEKEIMKRLFGENVPGIAELYDSIDLMILNAQVTWDNNRALPPAVINVGGLHQKDPEQLPHELQASLDSSKHGVIYMSFGTNVNPLILSKEKIQVFCRVFSRLPYDVIWKWNGDILPGKPENVNISKWLPQSDLLRHPKIKLFITQGGLQSTDEAITAGVPLIAFPMLGDQWYNAEKYVYHKIGIKMDFDTVTEESLEKSIKTIIGDDSYKKNINRLNKIMKDQPQTPLERAVWWTEYVIRHGGAKHLRSPAANISWAEYLILDVVAVLLAALVVATLVFVFTIKFMLRMLFFSKKVKVN